MTSVKSDSEDTGDGELAEQLEVDKDQSSHKTPRTPTRKVIKTGIRDQRPTPGRKAPPRGSPPTAFRLETDLESMRNPSPLPPPAKKRPRGSPTYDAAGFELDYGKVADWMKPQPYDKERTMRGMDKAVEKARREKAGMAEIFFRRGPAPQDPGPLEVDFWKDRVSKDLGIPFHKIDAAAFEEWERRGFEKQWPSDWESFTDEEKKRIRRMQAGCTLRK
ncbi:hypothetical protein A1O1_02290 [Capronia coronata CBS 617.96]|uniref:Uncharacterized protein n=1 Tax=Capronia coronata CBS 617.96 TaxID=1182541 RepID=W9YLY9_9EURO|nr:uncharacterized protein A1O1_02290 [Capronia coronata CBS 617.96]EXJ93897.1 hypothetical protein A1O1_02290 [Capronia coronata CBS 617.96]